MAKYKLVTCLVGDKYTEEMNQALNPDITYRGEFYKLPGVWNKLAMLLIEGPCFYIDIDSIIRGPLSSYKGTKLLVGNAYWKLDKEITPYNLDTHINSSVMYWEEPQTEIFNRFWKNRDYYMRKYKGIDRFLWWECKELFDTFNDGIFSSNANPYHMPTPILTYNGEDYNEIFKLRRI